MVRRILVCLAVVSGTFAVASPADAANFNIVVAKRSVSPGEAGALLKAKCPKRSRVVSGGVEIEGGLSLAKIVSTYPFDSRDRNKVPDDGWIGVASNLSSLTVAMRTYAVCTRLGLSGITYHSRLTDIDHLTSIAAIMDCPAGTEVTGGGGAVRGRSPLLDLDSSRPVARDPDDIANDGWIIGVRNTSGAEVPVVVYAICSAENLSHSTSVFTALDNAKSSETRFCPADRELVGGGAGVAVQDGHELVSTRPLIGTDPTATTDDGWHVETSNDSGAGRDITVTAICRPT